MSEKESIKIVRFNVGGIRYEVARSLLELHPDTMLARMVSEQWQENPDAEIFIERDGCRFKYVLDYLRDGKVHIPIILPKTSVADDMKYFAILFETQNIAYNEGGLYAPALSIQKKIEMLDNEGKEVSRRAEIVARNAEMYQFAKECIIRIVDQVKFGQSPPPKLRACASSDTNKNGFYSLCRSMSIVMKNPNEKDELLGICRRCGFVPIGIKAFSRKNQIGWEVSISY